MASIDPYAVGADSISARARLPYPQTRPVYNPLHACTYCAHGGVFMSYLDCAQYDCCHNKAGCCCLDGINVRHTGPGDAVCGRGCRHLEGRCCCADHVSIDECSCGPECATRAPRETAE